MPLPFDALDPRLAADSVFVADLPLCQMRLMNDATYPWLLLVPRRAGMEEIIDLPPPDRLRLMDEVGEASIALREITACDKLNIAALGNMVRQLHVHVIARFTADSAWPAPVWGKGPAKPYEPGAQEALVRRLAGRF